MEKQELLSELQKILGSDNVLSDEPMSRHTTFRIGGPADFLVKPENIEQIQKTVKFLNSNKIPFYVVGNGSNLLVSDNGINGVVIQFGENFGRYSFVQNTKADAVDKSNTVYVKVEAGMLLGRLGNELAQYSLTGFEFASGIPGTMGGAVLMNAGAYGGEIKDIFIKAVLMDRDGELFELDKNDMQFGYRTSIAAEKGYIVLETVLLLNTSSKEAVLEKMKELSILRRQKQPLEYPSAGSTFKRPEGYFAGKLISDAGLKGFSIGGAQVSEKHAGFVINTGNASAADVVALTDEVKSRVQKQFGVTLELEVKKMGF